MAIAGEKPDAIGCAESHEAISVILDLTGSLGAAKGWQGTTKPAGRNIDSRYSRPGGSEGEAYDVDAARRRLCAAAFRPARLRRSGPALAGSCLVAVSPLMADVTWHAAAACLAVVVSAWAATRSTAAFSALVHPSGIEGLIILARGPRYSARGFPA